MEVKAWLFLVSLSAFLVFSLAALYLTHILHKHCLLTAGAMNIFSNLLRELCTPGDDGEEKVSILIASSQNIISKMDPS